MNLSSRASEVSDDVAGIIVRNYLHGAHASGAAYEFHHESDLALNEVRNYARQIFSDKGRFEDASKAIAKHLYSKSTHPNISGGDLFVALFSLNEGGEAGRHVLGVFKTELTERFLVVDEHAEVLTLTGRIGIDPRDLQKAALIFEYDDSIVAIERGNTRTRYWLEDFLKVSPVSSAKGACAFLKQLAKKAASELKNVSSQAAYKASVSGLIDSDYAPSVGDMLEMTSSFVGDEQTAKIVDKIESDLGYRVGRSEAADVKQLRRSLNAMLRSMPVAHGIDLVFSKGVSPISIDVTPPEGEGVIKILVKVQRKR